MNEYTEALWDLVRHPANVRDVMLNTRWAGPWNRDSFPIGLSLLVGTVGMPDLRLLGWAVHRARDPATA